MGWPRRDEGSRGVWCQVRAQRPGPPPPRHTSQLCCTQVAPGQILTTKMPVSFQFGLKRHSGERRQKLVRRDLERTLHGPSESPVETLENSECQGGSHRAVSGDRQGARGEAHWQRSGARTARRSQCEARDTRQGGTGSATTLPHCPQGTEACAETPQSWAVLAGSCPSPRGCGGRGKGVRSWRV